MATAPQYTFVQAVAAAEGVRQTAKTAAFATYQAAGFTPGAMATFKAALANADVAYITAVNAARNTEAETLGNLGDSGPVGGNIGNLLNGY